MDRTLSELRALRADDVPPIDWAKWEKEIATPNVVANIRKEFEAHQYETTDTIDINAFRQEAQQKIEFLEKWADFSKQFKQQLSAEHAKVANEAPNYADWEVEDWWNQYSWMKKKVVKDAWNDQWHEDNEETVLGNMDANALAKAQREGHAFELPPLPQWANEKADDLTAKLEDLSARYARGEDPPTEIPEVLGQPVKL